MALGEGPTRVREMRWSLGSEGETNNKGVGLVEMFFSLGFLKVFNFF